MTLYRRLRVFVPRPARRAVGFKMLYSTALIYRRTALRRVQVVGITGSAGKTMAKELLVAILAAERGAGCWTPRGLNEPWNVAFTILRTRPWHRFCVLEIAGNFKPIERAIGVARPRVAVLTTVGADHISAFGSIDAIAAEKSKLVAALPPGGTAVLNADDPRVLAMREQCAGRRVLTYGVASDAWVRASDIQGRWPDRLSFTVHHDGTTSRVETLLCGTQWVPSVLAALTTALALGVPLARAIASIGTVTPARGRMCPVTSPDGVTFIADTVKAPYWSVPLTLQFLREARAPRKIFVLGTISDYRGASGPKYIALARQALDVADHVVCIGPRASTCMKAKRHPKDDAVHGVLTLDAARQYVERLLQPGDLVLLKGSLADRLEGLVQTRIVACENSRSGTEATDPATGADRAVQVIVGLGNPGEHRSDTPHNVGQRVVDAIGVTLGALWAQDGDALVARVEHRGGVCYLVKSLTPINSTGLVLRRLADRLGFRAADCILLQDDLDLPVGAVRTRMAGGTGGHHGVRSVLEAFETFAVRRVKIGVGRPAERGAVVRHVLGVLDSAALAVIDRACAEAAARALELAGIERPDARLTEKARPASSGGEESPKHGKQKLKEQRR